jgi:hypothetical protein
MAFRAKAEMLRTPIEGNTAFKDSYSTDESRMQIILLFFSAAGGIDLRYWVAAGCGTAGSHPHHPEIENGSAG